ncbi:MAG: hypothetical protein HC803_07665 [Saprospiraceae bacterium]|nr:hypothetical protein [Saprospiraceae bacterium]
MDTLPGGRIHKFNHLLFFIFGNGSKALMFVLNLSGGVSIMLEIWQENSPQNSNAL